MPGHRVKAGAVGGVGGRVGGAGTWAQTGTAGQRDPAGSRPGRPQQTAVRHAGLRGGVEESPPEAVTCAVCRVSTAHACCRKRVSAPQFGVTPGVAPSGVVFTELSESPSWAPQACCPRLEPGAGTDPAPAPGPAELVRCPGGQWAPGSEAHPQVRLGPASRRDAGVTCLLWLWDGDVAGPHSAPGPGVPLGGCGGCSLVPAGAGSACWADAGGSGLRSPL